MLGGLCLVHLAMGGLVGYGWRARTQQQAVSPRQPIAAVGAPSPSTPRAFAHATLVVGASPWSEPTARSSSQTPTREGTILAPETGDPLPDRVAGPRSCDVRNEARFLGRSPHVPLAVVRHRSLESVSRECYARWSTRGARWRALDAWGQVVGVAETVGGEGYAITHAYELSLAVRSGSAGTGLYVGELDPWQPSPSAEWTPPQQARESYQRLLAQSDAMFAEPVQSAPANGRAARTTMFFFARDTAGQTRYFAASGGRAFTIAQLSADGAEWRFVHMTRAANSARANAFELIGVIDFVGDGVPEVIVHNDESDGFWDDQVFVSDDVGANWGVDVRSAGGGTV